MDGRVEQKLRKRGADGILYTSGIAFVELHSSPMTGLIQVLLRSESGTFSTRSGENVNYW